jgi:hypothetical protein
MAVKRTWAVAPGSTGRRLRHLYTGSTLTGMRYEAYVTGLIADGPEKGREIVMPMDGDSAIALGQRLISLGNLVNNVNRGMS